MHPREEKLHNPIRSSSSSKNKRPQEEEYDQPKKRGTKGRSGSIIQIRNEPQSSNNNPVSKSIPMQLSEIAPVQSDVPGRNEKSVDEWSKEEVCEWVNERLKKEKPDNAPRYDTNEEGISKWLQEVVKACEGAKKEDKIKVESIELNSSLLFKQTVASLQQRGLSEVAADAIIVQLQDQRPGEIVRARRITGDVLVQLTEEKLTSYGLTSGAAMKLMTEINKLKEIPNDAYLMLVGLALQNSAPPPTAVQYSYEVDKEGEKGRWQTMKDYWNELTKNFEVWFAGDCSNKQNWYTCLAYGFSGVGKTRFTLELLGLLQEYSHTEEASSYAHIDKLREKLAETRMVYLTFVNGNAPTERDKVNPSKLTLGFRVACAYWYPSIPVQLIESALKEKYKFTNYDYLNAFHLSLVLELMKKHPGSLNKVAFYHGKAAFASKPRSFLILIDECQAVADIQVKYEGYVSGIVHEPLSKCYYRSLVNVSMELAVRREIYVFGLFAGLSNDPELFSLGASEYPSAKAFLLNTLSEEASKSIVKGWKSKDWKGEDWFNGYGEAFNLLVKACGGNTRCLEGLEKALASENLTELRLREISIKVSDYVRARWRGGNAEGLATLISLSGMPIDNRMTLYSDGKTTETVTSLQKSGYLQVLPALVEKESVWKSNEEVLLFVPLFIADAALKNLPEKKNIELNNLYIEAQALSSSCMAVQKSPRAFESLLFQQSNFRYNLAMYLARLEKEMFINSRVLFYGAFCQKSITALKFKVTLPVQVRENEVAGNWCTSLEGKIPDTLTLQNTSKKIHIFTEKPDPVAFELSGQNVFDTFRSAILHPSGQGVIIWNDQTHGQTELMKSDLTINKIEKIMKKAEIIAKKKPNIMHIVCGATNKPYGSFNWSEEKGLTVGSKGIRVPDNVCFYVAENIKFLFSPVLEPFFPKPQKKSQMINPNGPNLN